MNTYELYQLLGDYPTDVKIRFDGHGIVGPIDINFVYYHDKKRELIATTEDLGYVNNADYSLIHPKPARYYNSAGTRDLTIFNVDWETYMQITKSNKIYDPGPRMEQLSDTNEVFGIESTNPTNGLTYTLYCFISRVENNAINIIVSKEV